MGLRNKLLLPATVLILGGSVLSCGFDKGNGNDNPIKPPVANILPNTAISHTFGNNGKVTYIVSGTDTDGSIDYISIKINEGTSQNVGNGSSRSIDIKVATNSIEAIAYDNKGGADSTPATYSFLSPTESQATAAIINVLNSRSSKYQRFERNVQLSLGASASFPVDFLITKNNGTDAVVCYVSHSENLTEKLANQAVLTSFGISSLYLPRIPQDEITSRVNSFINGF